MLAKRKSVSIAFSTAVLLVSAGRAAAQVEPKVNVPEEKKQAEAELDLAALIAELNPPTVDEIIASLQPIPTLEEVLAPLPDDPNAPYRRVLVGEQKQEVEELQNRIARYRQAGVFLATVPLGKRVLAIREQHQGGNHWQTEDARRSIESLELAGDLPEEAQSELAALEMLSNSAIELYEAGEYEDAIRITQRQVVAGRRFLSDDDPYLANALNNLAGCLKAQGQYAKAGPLYRQALAMRRKCLGDEHPEITRPLNNLAGFLLEKGEYVKASLLYCKALSLRRTLLGPRHLEVALTLNNLASLLHAEGDYDGAEPLFREALAIFRERLGEEHPRVAGMLHNLGELLRTKGDYAGAEPLYRESLAVFRKAYVDGHRFTALNLNNLALLLHSKGDYGRAEPLYREALAMRLICFNQSETIAGSE